MAEIIMLHARFAGPHFQSKTICFGREWHTHFVPGDRLEFSEYGRDRAFPHGAWLVMGVGIGALMWMAIIAAIF